MLGSGGDGRCGRCVLARGAVEVGQIGGEAGQAVGAFLWFGCRLRGNRQGQGSRRCRLRVARGSVGCVCGVQCLQAGLQGFGLRGKVGLLADGLLHGQLGGLAVGQVARKTVPSVGQGGNRLLAGQLLRQQGQGGGGGFSLTLQGCQAGVSVAGIVLAMCRVLCCAGGLVGGILEAAVKLGGFGPAGAEGLKLGLGRVMAGDGDVAVGQQVVALFAGGAQSCGGLGQCLGSAGLGGIGVAQRLERQAEGFGAVDPDEAVTVGQGCGRLRLCMGHGKAGLVQAGVRLGQAVVAGQVGFDGLPLRAGEGDGGLKVGAFGLQGGQRVGCQQVVGVALPGQGGDGGLGLGRAVIDRGRDGAVQAGAGDLFQKGGAFVRFGAQEGVEIALGQQDGAAKLVIGQAGQGLHLIVHMGQLAGQHLAVADAGDLAGHALQATLGPVAGAADGPARLVILTVDAGEGDGGPGLIGTAPQDGTGVLRLDLLAARIGDFVLARTRGQARCIAIEGQAQRVEEG